METPQSVLRSIRHGDWMISLDLHGAYLQVPDASGIASVSSLHHGTSSLISSGCCALGWRQCLSKADGSNIRLSPSLRCQDAQIPRRLVDSSRIQDHMVSRRGTGSCECVRSWDYKSISESRPWSHLRTWLISACRSSQFGSLQNRQRQG